MQFIQYTDFRNNAKEYFDSVQHGKSYIIIKRGNPVAELIPFNKKEKSWKKNTRMVSLRKDINTTKYIRQERDC